MPKKILALQHAFNTIRNEVEEFCKEHDLVLESCEATTKKEFLEYFANNDVLIICNTWPGARAFGSYDEHMIRTIAASGVKAIVHQGAGFDVVGDVSLWASLGVTVSNSPNAPAADTADTAMYLLLGASRQFTRFEASLRRGHFRGTTGLGPSPIGKTVGILGMGNIGRMIRDRCAPFGISRVIYHGRNRLPPELEKDSVYEPDLEKFLRELDILVLVAPHNKTTHHIINRKRLFNVLKDTAVIVNVARGPLIDEEALVDALKAGKIASVGLDVYEHEPHPHPGLLETDRALLLPHIGAFTEHAMLMFQKEMLMFLREYIENGVVPNQVN